MPDDPLPLRITAAHDGEMECPCAAEAERCDLCVSQYLLWFASDASRTGKAWARRIAFTHPERLDEPWPSTPKARELAVKQLHRRPADARTLNAIIDNVLDAASYEWEHWRLGRGELQPFPGCPPVYVHTPQTLEMERRRAAARKQRER